MPSWPCDRQQVLTAPVMLWNPMVSLLGGVHMAYLGNPSFANGLGGWRPINLSASVATAIGGSGESPYSGSSFLRFQTSASGGSVGIDFDPVAYNSYTFVPSPNGQGSGVMISSPVYAQHVCAQAIIRARPGAGPVSGELTFWELGLPSGRDNHPRTGFTVGAVWTPVSVAIDRVGAGLHPWLRLEIYLTTLNVALDIGLVSVS